MFTISKTAHKMAKRRGIELTISEGIGRNDETLLCFWEAEEESEWIFSYMFSGDQLEWHGNIYASDSFVAALPPVIADDSALRAVICKLSEQLKNKPKEDD